VVVYYSSSQNQIISACVTSIHRICEIKPCNSVHRVSVRYRWAHNWNLMINCSGELHIVATKGRLNCVAERTTDVCHNLRGSCILNLDFNCAAFGHCICERINNAPSSSNRELISRTNCWIIYQTYLYSCCIRANL
jgi:hypothetical protein